LREEEDGERKGKGGEERERERNWLLMGEFYFFRGHEENFWRKITNFSVLYRIKENKAIP
jgi:hypothetical protein